MPYLEGCPLYEPERGWLFSGDAFIGGRDRALLASSDIHQIIASLKKLAALEITRLFPGSGTVRENPGQELRRKIEDLEALGERIQELHRQGLSGREIKRRILGAEPFIAYITLGHFSAENLVRSYLEGAQR